MQFMLKIVVCDDDALCCKEIVKGIRDTLGSTPADISDFRDPTLLLEHLRKTDCQPHIALLDICMPEQDGIRLAQSTKQYAPFCQIIFLSSYLSYATEVYETEHIYFILKSQLHQRIGPALHQALTALGDRSVQITAQKDGSTHVIALQDVLYLERNLRKTKVITQQGVFLTQESPETLISGSGHFVRCHQSYWVNLKHVQAIGSNHFTMDSGSGIPISRTYLQEDKQRFLHELIHI